MTSIAPNTATASPPGPVPYDIVAIKKKVQKAKSLLYLDHPFFGAAASKRPIIYTDRVGSQPINTAAMSATGQMYMNPSFAMGLSTREMMFLLAHEAMHYMLCHSLRRGTRDAEAWNVACDLVINDTLIFENVGDFIKGGLTFDGARDMASEALYADPPEGGTGGTGNGGIGDDILDPVGDDGRPLDESEIHRIEAQAKIDILQSSKAAKARGKLSAGLERLVDELVKVTTPWHVILERFMVTLVKDDRSWKRQNRRFIHHGVYLPGNDYKPRMGEMVIGVDTSGSIGQPELNEFNAHVDRIIETCSPEKVTVVYCDYDVNHVDEFTPDDFPVRLSPYGGGGTSFDPVFKYIDEHGLEPEVVVYLTDGYGNQNEFTTHHQTVWLTTASEDFEWGTVIKYEAEN